MISTSKNTNINNINAIQSNENRHRNIIQPTSRFLNRIFMVFVSDFRGVTFFGVVALKSNNADKQYYFFQFYFS